MKKHRFFLVALLILFLITPSFGGYVTEKNGKKGYKGNYIKRSYTNYLPAFIPIWNFAYINPLPGAQRELPVINIEGTYTIPNEFDNVEIIAKHRDAIVVSKDGKKGIVIGPTKYENIKLIYDDVIPCYRYIQDEKHADYAIVKKDGKFGVVKILEKLPLYIPIEYDNIIPYLDYYSYFITELNGKKGFVGFGIKDSKQDTYTKQSPY